MINQSLIPSHLSTLYGIIKVVTFLVPKLDGTCENLSNLKQICAKQTLNFVEIHENAFNSVKCLSLTMFTTECTLVCFFFVNISLPFIEFSQPL